MTIDSESADLSRADLNQIGADITSTVASGVFSDTLAAGGLEVAVIIPPPPALSTSSPTGEPTPAGTTSIPTAEPTAELTAEPTAEPTIIVTAEPTASATTAEPTAVPTAKPTAEPTAEPTIASDPCPGLSENCEACVASAECLWCRGEDICFNSDPEIAEASKKELLSDVDTSDIEALEAVCAGTVTGSLLVCNLPPVVPTEPTAPAPTDPPVAPAPAPPQDSGGSPLYLSSNNVLMNTIMSSICMTMLLLYRH
jgi:hypothetical protein